MKKLRFLDRLFSSADPLERDLAATLRSWQDQKQAAGKRRSLGYEPRDFNRLGGAIGLITRRVLARSKGFDDLPAESYEAIVVKYSDRFDNEVVAKASDRLNAAGVKF